MCTEPLKIAEIGHGNVLGNMCMSSITLDVNQQPHSLVAELMLTTSLVLHLLAFVG